jgi:hypothetical protein
MRKIFFPLWSLHLLPPTETNKFCFSESRPFELSPWILLDFGKKAVDSFALRSRHRQVESPECFQIQQQFTTCEEVLQIIQEIPMGRTPILFFDLLEPFFEDDLELEVRDAILKQAIFHLKRLSHGAGPAVIVPFPPACFEAYYLLGRLVDSAPRMIPYTEYPANVKSMNLF